MTMPREWIGYASGVGELENQFSWSRSRDNAFQECRRRYWIHYYGSWGGWERDAPTSVRRAYLLKQVASRHQWVGQEVHERVRMCLKMLKAGQTPELETQMNSLVDTMRRRFKESRKGEWVHNPKNILRLFEHEYAFTIRDEKWIELREHAKDCLRGFFESPYFELAKSLPTDRWLAVDDLDQFDLDGTPVWVALDFAFRREGGGCTNRRRHHGPLRRAGVRPGPDSSSHRLLRPGRRRGPLAPPHGTTRVVRSDSVAAAGFRR